jgi:tetratricopeptide (TPR) repeat protein
LPFVAIGDVAFESLCLDALRIEYPDLTSVALKRRRGMRQFGVDAEGFGASGHPTVVLSAKCYREVLPQYLEPWADDFIQELDKHWKGKKVEVFVLAVTHDGNDDLFNDARRQIAGRLAEHNIRFELWTSYDLTASIRQDAGLVRRYFTDAWAEAVSANEAGQVSAVIPRSAASRPGLGPILSQIIDIADEGLRNRLKHAEREQSAGRASDLKSFLFGGMTQALWDSSSPEVRAKLLRKKAILFLREGAIREARETLGEAEGLAPAEDGYERAWLAAAEGDVLSGLSVLGHASRPREVILKAAWLLQIQKVDPAWALLGTLAPADLSCEALRVRALVACRRGEFASATKDIAAARRLEPDTANLSLSEGAILLASALAPGTTAEIGETPNPIHAGLLRTGADAVASLNEAARIFRALTVSTEPPFRGCAEVWLLATLLLHPARRAEARRYFRALVAREEIDPITVAWGIQFGLPMRVGRIRRALTGPLRRGDAEPTHAIVLALLDGKSDRAKGLATLQRNEAAFKDAPEFFDDWRRKFGWRGGGAEEDASGIVIALSGNAGALMAHLLDKEVPSEELLAGASLLASRGEWQAIVPLSGKLMGLETEEGVYLAARASWECKSPEDALKRLAEHAHRVDGGNLAYRLLQIRSDAYRAVGRAADAIADLGAMLQLSPDPIIRHRRMGALATIGDIDGFEMEANAALARPGIPAREAVAIADFLKAHRPDTARLAIKTAVRSVPDTPDLAPTILSVASHLGLEEVQRQLMPIVMSHADLPGSGVTSFTLDDLPKLLQRDAETARRQMEEWLGGRIPASIAFREAGYAKLLLGERDDRMTAAGDPFPMLVSAGKARRAVEGLHRSSSRLVVELSGLLFAFRLALLDSIEQAFQIEVVPSVPEALIAIEEALQSPSPSILADCRKFLEVAAGLLTIAGDTGASTTDWVEVGLLQIVESAFLSGYLDIDQLERGRHAFLSDEDAPKVLVSGIVLRPTSQAIFALARAGLLIPIASARQIQMPASEADALSSLLDTAEREGRIRAQVMELRELTTARLTAGRWLMTPTDGQPARKGPIFPPVPRCFSEAVFATEDQSKLIFIEDRFIAKAELPNCIDIVGLLDLLEERGCATTTTRAASLRSLRDIGYAFLDPSVPPIIQSILSAKIAEETIVENDDLARWRSWFARSLQESGHADATLKQDAEGRVAGEPRYVLDLMGLARRLLLEIWQQDAEPDVSRARSEWVWMAFRPEGGLGLPTKPEGRLRLASATLAYTFLAPFVDWSSENVELPPRLKDMFEWFDDAVLGPAIAAEPTLGNAIADELAVALEKFVQVPSRIRRADRGPLQKALVGRVNRLLSLLPNGWVTKISDRRGLAKTLGIRDQVSLTLKGGVKVSAAALTEAAARARSSSDGTGSVPLLGGGAATARLVQADDLTTIQLTIDGSQMRLDPVTSALALDDAKLRRSAMLTGVARMAGDAVEWLRVAEIELTEARFAAAALIHEADFSSVLEPFERIAEHGGSLDAAYFVLPEPSAIRNYLGFGSAGIVDADGCERAFSNLSSTVGTEEAARRFSSLPFDLPAAVSAEIAIALGSLAGLPSVMSPLFARTFALVTVDSQRRDAAKILAESIKGSGRFFCSLVRQAAAQSNASPSWQALSKQERLSLLWCYADAITGIFAPAENKLDELANYVGSIATPTCAFKPGAPRHEWEGRLTDRLVVRDLSAAIGAEVATAWGVDADTDVMCAVFHGLTGVAGKAGWGPHAEFTFPPPTAPSGYWAARDPLEKAVELGLLASESPFAVRDPNETARAIIGGTLGLAAGIGAPVFGFAEFRDIESALIPRILDFLDGERGEERFEPSKRGTGLSLLARAKTTGISGETSRFIEGLRTAAKRCREAYPKARLGFLFETDEAALSVAAMMDCSFEHATALGRSASECFDAIGQCARAIVEEWPGALRGVIGVVDATLRVSSADDAAVLAKHFRHLRSLH